MIGRQQWDIGMAVKADYRQLGYAVGDIVDNMVKSGEMKAIFAKYNATYKLPDLYKVEE